MDIQCKEYCGTGTFLGGGDYLGHHPLGHVPQVAAATWGITPPHTMPEMTLSPPI